MTNFEFIQKKYRESLKVRPSGFNCIIGVANLTQCHTRQLGHWRSKLWTNPMFASCRRCEHWLSDEDHAKRKARDNFIPVELTKLIYRKRTFQNMTEPRPYTYVDTGMPVYTPAEDVPDEIEINFKEIAKLKRPTPDIDEGPDDLNKVETPGENAENERPGGGNQGQRKDLTKKSSFDWRKDLPDGDRWKI